jgi:cyclase
MKNIGAAGQRVLLSLVLLSGVNSCCAQSVNFNLQKLGDGVWTAVVSDSGTAGGNAGFVVGDDSIAVIDTFQDAGAARELLAAIRQISSLPIRFVVNTHYHLDHVAGNQVFASAGAVVIAHRNVRAWARTENLKFWGDAIKPEDKALVQALKLPDVIYDDHLELYLGKRMLQVRFLRGHTGGDSVLYVPDARVLFCGDLLWKDHLPNLIDASTDKWIATLDLLSQDYAESTLVPGHGSVAQPHDVAVFKDYLVSLREVVRQAQLERTSDDALVNAILPGLKEKYGTWGFFDDFAKTNILQTAHELAGDKRVPQPAGSGAKP